MRGGVTFRQGLAARPEELAAARLDAVTGGDLDEATISVLVEVLAG
jgi:hypothetical protein